MVCRRCRYQNSAGAKYCAGCGRKLSQKNQDDKNVLISVAACVLIIAIGIGTLFFKADNDTGGKGISENGSTDVVAQSMAAEIRQVLPVDDGSIASLYSDGTVRVSENSSFWGEVSEWQNVEKLYYNKTYEWNRGGSLEFPVLFGLTKDGSVLSTDGSLSSWSNVKELHFTWQGAVGVTNDGRILVDATWEDEFSKTALTGMSDVKTLTYSDIQSTFACLKKDGTVHLISENGYLDPDEVRWENVKEVRDAGHSFYVINHDGTFDGDLEVAYTGLKNAVKVVSYNDWVFGISADGRLLTYNGGNIYTNTGDMMVDVPGLPYYGGEIDISQFSQVRDIVPFWGLILLYEDGTAEHIGEYPHWDLSAWYEVKKVSGCRYGEGTTNLYGVQKDGSVVLNQYDWSQDEQTVLTQYRGWMLQDIYAGSEGVVGLTTDGKLVGDGIYENVNYSVFE